MSKIQLNAQQLEAVRYLGGPLLVLAGAGSGKTGVITRKIAWMIENQGIPARHILAVTFTNKAAREMKARVSGLLDSDRTRGLRVSTFHQLGLNILRQEYREAGLNAGFTLLDEQDTLPLVRELLHTPDAAQANAIRWQISTWKNSMLTPRQAEAAADDQQSLHAALCYGAYERSLRAYNAVDFDDLIWLPVKLFNDRPEILERWQGRLQYLLVDEYQDTNLSQYQLIKQLAGIRQALTVVGDDDQSIYAWRGANPENMLQLQRDFPRLKVIKLEQNYRSVDTILKAANALIANNPHLFEKRLWSSLGPGGKIRVMRCKDEEHEAERVISDILVQKFKGRALGDIAVLYRGNHQARLFEKALRQHDLPYFLSGGQSFFGRAEIKDTMAFLRLIANPDDNAAFLRIINVPRREIGPATLEKLGAYANQRGISLLSACGEYGLDDSIDARRRGILRQFHDWMQLQQNHCVNLGAAEAITNLLHEIDYMALLRERGSAESVAQRRWDNIEELLEWLQRLQLDAKNEPHELVNQLTLIDILERQDEDNEGERISLMTLHSAKGLEFPQVYLVGMEEELLPHRASIEEENIDEERRLAYVGITRARHHLAMTLARRRRRFGEWILCEPSRFLEEIPDACLEWEGEGQQKQVTRETGKAHLANIRALLKNG
ncbi:MAG: UvrD-helicase domain-containing protein [Pseudomonadota bacterium]